MFKLMRSGCCFVFLFLSSPSLPLTHPLAFHSPSSPRLEHKPICQTIMKHTAWEATDCRGPPGSYRRAVTTVKQPGSWDAVRSVHHYVSIHLKVQLSLSQSEAQRTKPDQAERQTLGGGFSTGVVPIPISSSGTAHQCASISPDCRGTQVSVCCCPERSSRQRSAATLFVSLIILSSPFVSL